MLASTIHDASFDWIHVARIHKNKIKELQNKLVDPLEYQKLKKNGKTNWFCTMEHQFDVAVSKCLRIEQLLLKLITFVPLPKVLITF